LCHDPVSVGVPQIDSTATYSDLANFDSIDVFYGTETKAYLTISGTNPYFSVIDLVKNQLNGFGWTGATFADISSAWYKNGVSVFSTNNVGLFRA
jgi:hypothetical protein